MNQRVFSLGDASDALGAYASWVVVCMCCPAPLREPLLEKMSSKLSTTELRKWARRLEACVTQKKTNIRVTKYILYMH